MVTAPSQDVHAEDGRRRNPRPRVAAEIELWQIDQSKPALRFNVLSQPTEISKQAVAIKSAGNVSEARKLQLEFWTSFREKLLEQKTVVSAQTPRPQYWFDVPLGRAGIHLSNIANTSDGRIGVRVYISNKIADVALPKLEEERKQIEAEIGEPLQWNPSPDNLDKIILLARDADLYDRDKWPEYVEWLVDKVGKFKNAFGPRVKQLNLSQPIETAP
jgi:hypothetical protein